MDSAVQLITELGFPIAAALGLGAFVWKLINRIIDGMEVKVDVLDEKLGTIINSMEERLGGKLDSQHGILGVPQLINIDKLAKADRDDQRKD